MSIEIRRTFRHCVVLSLSLTVAGTGPLAAEKQTPPPPGTPKTFKLPEAERYRLDNGLHVTLVDFGTLPKVRVELSVRAGNVHESASQVWLADLTGDMLMEGTRTRTAAEVSDAVARMGGALDVGVGAETAELSGAVLSRFGPDLVRLVADVARHPAFPRAEMERNKADQLRGLSIARSQPQQLAQEKFRALLYGDHPHGRLFPTPAMIETYTIKDVKGFWKRHFGPQRAHLYVVGRFEREAVKTAVREAFGSWTGAPASKSRPAAPQSTRSVHVVDRPGAVQSAMILGLPVVGPRHPDYMSLWVTNFLLGGYFSSRITANIREDKGYTYSPFSQISSRSGDAYWAQNANVTTNVTGAALKEIFFEIDRLRAEAPGEKELRGVQSYMAGTFVLGNASRSAIVNQLERLDLLGLPEDYLGTYLERLRAVKPKNIQAAARKYIRPEKITIVIVGDEKAIAKDLTPYLKAKAGAK